MTLTLELPPEVERVLEESAQANGQSLPEYAVSVLKHLAIAPRNGAAAKVSAQVKGRLAALAAIGTYDNRARAGLPPLDDSGISRADFYGYTEREDS